MSHLLISAAHKSSGKTTISLGICAAFSAQGMVVQPFKKGPDYIDPLWLSRASNRDCFNLDFQTQTDDEILTTVGTQKHGADLLLVEGNKGLHDGMDLHGSNSNAALAKLLQTPVVLVVDTRGMTRGVAPLLLGFQQFDPTVKIAGVILNQVGGSRHESKLRSVVEAYTDIPVLGAVRRDPALIIDERHLGLIPSNEERSADELIHLIGQRILDQVDLPDLKSLAEQAPPLPETGITASETNQSHKGLRIGIIRDAAFGFYYPDDLATFRAHGAELIFINSLTDHSLPPLDGLFVGGGFPETHLQALSDNLTMRDSIHSAIEAGLPVYAECGGLMYLSRRICWKDTDTEMVGAIPADVTMEARPQGRGYVQLEETADLPWPATGETATNSSVSAHEFHFSRLGPLPDDSRFGFRVTRGTGIDGCNDGFIYKNLVANYTHLRDTSRYHWVERFLEFVGKLKTNGSLSDGTSKSAMSG